MRRFIGRLCNIRFIGQEDCNGGYIPDIISGVVHNGIQIVHNGINIVHKGV